MQPDLRTPEKEEQQPEPLPLHDVPQRVSTPVAESAPTPPPIVEKKRSKLNIAAIVLGIFTFVLLIALTGLGYVAYTLRTELIATQQQLVALQGDHGKLQTDYTTLTSENEKLNADLTQSKADLEKANTDLSSSQADLKKSEDKNKNLDTQVNKASKLAEVLYAWTITNDASDVFRIDSLVRETKDQQLIAQWDKFTKSPSEEAFATFMNYLAGAIRNSLR